MENIFKGTGPAVITPFNDDLTIDFDSLGNILDYHKQEGIDFFVALGTTAETVTMTHDERHSIIDFFREEVSGKYPLMVGFGGNNTLEVVSHIKSANFKGIDGILSVVPYYSKPSQEGIYRHFMAIAEVSPVPIVLYNVPGRTGTNMTAETTIRLMNASDKFIGVKEASGDIEQIYAIQDEAPSYFGVLSGDDALNYEINSNSGQGIISVMANAFPKETKELTELSLSGDEKAVVLQEHYKKLMDLMFCEGNPAGVKAIMHQKGMIKRNVLRLPLCPVSDKTYVQISEELKKLKLK